MNIIKKISIILTSLLISIGSAQAETWNMALAYGAGNFHSQMRQNLQMLLLISQVVNLQLKPTQVVLYLKVELF